MTFLGNKENSENLYWGVKTWEASAGEMRPRIFDLLGNNSGGRMFYLAGEIRSSVCTPIYWGSWGILNGSHWGLIVGNLTSLGKKILGYSSSAGDVYFKVFGLHWGSVFQSFRAPLGILKFNSAGEIYSKFLALLRI